MTEAGGLRTCRFCGQAAFLGPGDACGPCSLEHYEEIQRAPAAGVPLNVRLHRTWDEEPPA
jgi:hypothetical protein